MLIAALAVLLVLWLATRPLYWWRRGVTSPLPLPLFGNCLPALYLSNVQFWQWLYRTLDGPYLGIFFFTRPALLLRDPQVIMEVLEKKAPCFSSHGMYINEERDPMGQSLFHLSGPKWKAARAKLSTYFSPAKVKLSSEIAERTVRRLLDYIGSELTADVDVYSAAMKLSIDATAASIFGLESNVFQDGDQSEYYIASKDLNTSESMLKVFVNFVSPGLFEIMKLNSFSTGTNQFIRNLVHGAFQASKQNPTLPNFIQGMAQLRENDKSIDDKFAVSQGATLWVGGVETTAATLSFCLFELAADPALQERLRGHLSQPAGRQLLRAVIAEALRKYPPFSLLSRCCTRDCTLDSGLPLTKGTLIFIPAYSLHHDPKIYPDPERFQPGREYPKGAYLPFGSGPRTCLGMRMAESLLELSLTKLLEQYRFSPSPKSQSPLKLTPRAFFTTAEGGLWVKIEKI